MKKFLACMAVVVVAFALVAQQNPSYRSFNTNQFRTNALPWPISLVSNLSVVNLTVLSNVFVGNTTFVSNSLVVQSNLTVNQDIYVSNSIVVQGTALNPQTLWLPTLDYELWYDPFAGSALSAGAVGQLGWTSVNLASGTLNVSNAVNHWGTIAMTTGTTSNAGMFQHLSDTPILKPTIPPLNSFAGWTNRIVWRLNGTNGVRGYLVLGAGSFTSTLDMTNCMGFAVSSGTNENIMGYCSDASANTTTNITALVSGTWYTNYMWCATPGTISFNINGGPEATINTTLPTSALNPMMGYRRTSATGSASMEIDEWMLVVKRQ